jgi:hypothetical protein
MTTQIDTRSRDAETPEPLVETEFVLPDTGLTAEQRAVAIQRLREYLSYHPKRFLGYQVNQPLQHESHDRAPFLDCTQPTSAIDAPDSNRRDAHRVSRGTTRTTSTARGASC